MLRSRLASASPASVVMSRLTPASASPASAVMMLKSLMSKAYSILAAAHELGVDPDACECALGTDSTTKHYLPGGGLAYDKLLASTHDQMVMSYAFSTPSIFW